MAKKIQVNLEVKDKGTAKIEKFSKRSVSAMRKLAGPVAIGAVVASLGKMLSSVTDLGDQLDKMSKRTGFSVTQLDKLRQSADLGGTSIETVERAIRKMQKNIVDASRDMGLANEAFKAMGISIDKLKKLNPEEQFQVLAREILKIKDPTLQAARAQEILGISGAQLIPMLKDIAGGLKDYKAVMDKDIADASARFKDEIDKMKTSIMRLTVDALGPALKALNAFYDAIDQRKKFGLTAALGDINIKLQKQKELLAALKAEEDDEMGIRNIQIELQEKVVDGLQKKFDALIKQIRVQREANKVQKEAIDVTGDATDETDDNTDAIKANNKARQDAIDKLRAQVKETEDAAAAIRQQRAAELGVGDEEFADFVTGFGLPDEEEEKDETGDFYNHQLEMQKKAIEDMLEADKIALEERNELYKTMALGMSTAIVNPLIDAALGAKDFKEAFREMAISILKQLAAIAIMKAIAGMGMGGGGGGMPHIPALADGGILKGGFKKFGFGGIADKPTLGLIGEGQFNEAVVPLPNGRSIPVDMQGDEGKTINNNFYVQALDSKSLVELMRRNPEAIIAPLTNQIELGNKGLRSNLKKAVA